MCQSNVWTIVWQTNEHNIPSHLSETHLITNEDPANFVNIWIQLDVKRYTSHLSLGAVRKCNQLDGFVKVEWFPRLSKLCSSRQPNLFYGMKQRQ